MIIHALPNVAAHVIITAMNPLPDPTIWPCLLADVGGTHVRFARVLMPGGTPVDIQTIETADHPTMVSAASLYRASTGQAPRPFASAVIAVAAPITNGRIRLTNTAFAIDPEAIRREFAISVVRLINDFEALAWALPTLRDDDLRLLGKNMPGRRATMAVIGPGTGLGCAGMLRSNGRWHAVPGEGGHATLSAQTDREAAVIAAARRTHGHVSAERLLSGIGLPSLYRALAQVEGRGADPSIASAVDVTEGAERDALLASTVDLFGALLGGFAGNIALSFGATGGLLLGGGIAPKIATRLETSPFRERFESKGRFKGYLEGIGTAIIVRPEPALDGLATMIGQTPT